MTKLDELRRLSREATLGPWVDGGEVGDLHYVNCNKLLTNTGLPTAIATRIEADAKLIAAARNNLDALLDVAEAAKKFIDVCADDGDQEYCEDLAQRLADALEKLK